MGHSDAMQKTDSLILTGLASPPTARYLTHVSSPAFVLLCSPLCPLPIRACETHTAMHLGKASTQAGKNGRHVVVSKCSYARFYSCVPHCFKKSACHDGCWWCCSKLNFTQSPLRRSCALGHA